jgi:hypothetical protein
MLRFANISIKKKPELLTYICSSQLRVVNFLHTSNSYLKSTYGGGGGGGGGGGAPPVLLKNGGGGGGGGGGGPDWLLFVFWLFDAATVFNFFNKTASISDAMSFGTLLFKSFNASCVYFNLASSWLTLASNSCFSLMAVSNFFVSADDSFPEKLALSIDEFSIASENFFQFIWNELFNHNINQLTYEWINI